MKSGPSSWFAHTEINGKMFNCLIDSGASKSVISRNFYDSLPESKPSIQNTNIKFCVFNGSVNKTTGMCHLPVMLTFGSQVKSICLPVFVCDFLSPNVNCVFGIDAATAFKYVLCYDTGTIWCSDDPNQSPLYCIPNVITQDDNVYARVLEKVVIKAQSFAPIEVGTHNSMPPEEWCSQVLCTCTDNLWKKFGAIALQGMVDFTKGPTTLCIINTTPQDLILKSNQIIANLAPIELQESNTYPILGSKTGGSCDVNQLLSLFQE